LHAASVHDRADHRDRPGTCVRAGHGGGFARRQIEWSPEGLNAGRSWSALIDMLQLLSLPDKPGNDRLNNPIG
jgi:hypothetical protein